VNRLALVVAFLLALPVSPAAACHRFARWSYPWPQTCGVRHVAARPVRLVRLVRLEVDPPKQPPAPPVQPEQNSPTEFAAQWEAFAADAKRRNITPACGADHCTLVWRQDESGLTVMLFSYTDGSHAYCVDDDATTIECRTSDGRKQSVEVKGEP
jgi:hypothetical protein